MDDPSVELVARWRGGDERAAAELFGRYADRLLGLARRHLTARLAGRVDVEDVIQSACRSFFAGARDGRFVVEHSGDLWRLLVTLTLRKLHNQVRWHSAGKRAVGQEDPSAFDLDAHVAGREPTPDEAAALADLLEHLLAAVPAPHRPVVELRLQGYELEEIADRVGCCRQTVIRVLRAVRARLDAWPAGGP